MSKNLDICFKKSNKNIKDYIPSCIKEINTNSKDTKSIYLSLLFNGLINLVCGGKDSDYFVNFQT